MLINKKVILTRELYITITFKDIKTTVIFNTILISKKNPFLFNNNILNINKSINNNLKEELIKGLKNLTFYYIKEKTLKKKRSFLANSKRLRRKVNTLFKDSNSK